MLVWTGRTFLLSTWKSIWMTYHAHKRRCSEHGFWKSNVSPRSIPMFVDKDSILFRTEIIYRFGSKDFVLIHHTVSSTNRSRSVSFPRWVFLIISGNLIVRTGNWKTNTNLPIWNIWFPESEDLNLQFWGSGWYRNNWKPKSGDYSSQNPNQNLRKL